MSNPFTDLGPVSEADKKAKAKAVRVKLLTSRTNGLSSHEPGAVISLPLWEAERMASVGQCEIVPEK